MTQSIFAKIMFFQLNNMAEFKEIISFYELFGSRSSFSWQFGL